MPEILEVEPSAPGVNATTCLVQVSVSRSCLKMGDNSSSSSWVLLTGGILRLIVLRRFRANARSKAISQANFAPGILYVPEPYGDHDIVVTISASLVALTVRIQISRPSAPENIGLGLTLTEWGHGWQPTDFRMKSRSFHVLTSGEACTRRLQPDRLTRPRPFCRKCFGGRLLYSRIVGANQGQLIVEVDLPSPVPGNDYGRAKGCMSS